MPSIKTFLGAYVVCILFTHPALAQPSSGEADRLFHEGLERMDEGKCSEALEKFRRALELEPSPQKRYNAARCLEKLDQLVLAMAEYGRAATEAGTTEAADKTRSLAREARDALAARVPRLRVHAQTGRPTLTLDGAPFDAAALDAPAPVNPGQHTLVAEFGDGRRFERPFSATPSAATEIRLDVAQAPALDEGSRPVPVVAWITAGAALASFGAAGYFALGRSSAIADADAECPARSCPDTPATRDAVDAIARDTHLTNAFVGVGALATVATVAIVVFRPTKSAPSTALVAGPSLHQSGVVLRGVF